jgi:hypothetical protein
MASAGSRGERRRPRVYVRKCPASTDLQDGVEGGGRGAVECGQRDGVVAAVAHQLQEVVASQDAAGDDAVETHSEREVDVGREGSEGKKFKEPIQGKVAVECGLDLFTVQFTLLSSLSGETNPRIRIRRFESFCEFCGRAMRPPRLGDDLIE